MDRYAEILFVKLKKAQQEAKTLKTFVFDNSNTNFTGKLAEK